MSLIQLINNNGIYKLKLLLIFLIIFIPRIITGQMQKPIINAVRTDLPPIIDGIIDDQCWQLCNPVTDFYMVEPNPGAPVTQSTFVYICYDDEKIYFGIHMNESKLNKMQTAANQRDGEVYRDDAFELIIDTYCDRRNAYYFASNLIGTKLDGRIIDDGRNIDQTWDCHWEVKSQIVETGWEMEIAIPFTELSFPQKDTMTWGINFWRVERPHWENTSWAPVQSFEQVSKYGTMTGLSVQPKIKKYTVIPYIAGRYEEDSLEWKAGIDFEYDLTSNLIFNATYLPDFAQIEADPLKFNLSYQQGEELYFPEKRPFFLEGGVLLRTPINLFYTRRMNEILAGGKLYGKIKSTEILAIDVQTKDSEENFSVLRLKQEIFTTSTFGILATNKSYSDTFSRAFGIDLNLPVYRECLLTSQVAVTQNTGVSGDQLAYNIHIGGETSSYGLGLGIVRIGPDFKIEQGFVNNYYINKEGINSGGWINLFQDKGWFKWINTGFSFNVYREINDEISYTYTKYRLNFVTKPKWRLGMYGLRKYECYDEVEFINKDFGVEIESNTGGITGIFVSYTKGTFYELNREKFHFAFIMLPFNKIFVYPSFQAVQVGEEKWEWLTNIRISYQITDKAFVRFYVQSESENTPYETERYFDLENIETLKSNFLFGYEFLPGSILYLVYNQVKDFDNETIDHVFMTKFTYSFQF